MNDIKLSIIICTYKREQYVLKNIELLNKECRDFVYKVFVIDNGQTLDTKLSNGFINIIPNKNLGGSGGYARGMYEARKEGKSSHIMLMDDDIEFSSNSLKEAHVNLLNSNNNDWLAFGMVAKEKPNEYFECGSFWNGIRVVKSNNRVKLNDKNAFKVNKYNFSGWWAIIMPINVITKYSYPFPFFIKFDDTEYGMRRKDDNIIFKPNLYVFHESFKSKYSPVIEYYGLRNALITNLFHLKHDKFLSLFKYSIKLLKRYFAFNYQGVKMINLGLKDFLKGPIIFMEYNMEQFNLEIRNISRNKNNVLLTFFSTPFVCIKNVFSLLVKYKKIKEKYIEQYKYLTSEEYWKRKFGI